LASETTGAALQADQDVQSVVDGDALGTQFGDRPKTVASRCRGCGTATRDEGLEGQQRGGRAIAWADDGRRHALGRPWIKAGKSKVCSKLMPAGHSPGQGKRDARCPSPACPEAAAHAALSRYPAYLRNQSPLSLAPWSPSKHPQPASQSMDEIDPNFPCPALSANPVSPGNVRHSSGATSSCSCQTTTARTSRGALESNRRRARTRRISSRPGTTGPGYSVLGCCRAGPAFPPSSPRNAATPLSALLVCQSRQWLVFLG
jgi:hypothetical protein